MARGHEVITVSGRARELVTGRAGELRAELRESDVDLALEGSPIVAAYRDLTTIAVQHGQVLLVLGEGQVRLLVEKLGDRLGLLVQSLRERRARQVLADRFIELDADETTELVEYESGEQRGVAQLAYHAWGAALMPLDERQRWVFIRRARIERVVGGEGTGSLRVEVAARPGSADPAGFALSGLGAHAEQHRRRLNGLREAALSDAAGIVNRLIPDAPFGARQVAAGQLVDGHPADRATLGEGWAHIERAVLAEPTYAAAYRALRERGDGPTWLALAPRRPGQPEHLAWFFVGLPANLVALELVSSGAHATYLFRVVPRSAYGGQSAAELADQAAVVVDEVSEALIDMRFLRQPIYLDDQQLADPRHLRSRLAIAALPSLRAARQRFVGRLIHRDEESWSAALEDAIGWHSRARDDEQRWPGRRTAADDDAGEDTSEMIEEGS
jgi:hypothetical protein